MKTFPKTYLIYEDLRECNKTLIVGTHVLRAIREWRKKNTRSASIFLLSRPVLDLKLALGAHSGSKSVIFPHFMTVEQVVCM